MHEPTIHPFEQAGLGLAPFYFKGLEDKVYQACPGAPIQPAGTCEYCGQGIRYCCNIESSDGKRFVVGTDCVRKLERADNKLVSEVEREVAKQQKKKRDEARAAKYAERERQREAKLQAERDRNGGLTDRELAEKQRQEEEAKQAETMQAQNSWLLSVLKALPYREGFVGNMIEQLSHRPLSSLSDRCQGILRDIYAKNQGRRGSKAYKAAEDEFDEKASVE